MAFGRANRVGSEMDRSHGTRCAGEIIMQPDNGICGVGTAHGASLGGKQDICINEI